MKKCISSLLISLCFLFSAQIAAHELGLQLFSLRHQFADDPAKTLDQIQDWGLHTVEGSRDLYGYSVEEFRAELDKRGIDVVSTDTSFEELRDNPMAAVYRAKFYAANYTTFYWVPHGDNFLFDDADKTVKVMNEAGALLKKHGVTLQYHAHGYEYLPYKNETLFDYIIQNVDQAQFQMDVFWTKHAGMNPTELLKKYPGRFTSLHLKDRKKGTPNSSKGSADGDTNVVLGQGDVGIASVVAEAKKQGIRYFFLEDESSRVVQQIPKSILYLKSLEKF
ncbi:sugar phosphate isomerase/epimerase [Aliiglaciecola sp. 3_MG-2023]|uniref:sugar phosphate isomerase/epimerase family protein n=1 Tax=Aliiglaciecola sp. 3_MG-2023 TaxID=3062644 RepID=UPI0026E19554|nr:sugar phosphate isomerase/epimerase [Aliiglaciecola sp. 3_MG-2023]MDO6694575.1 sugar phosphate isomerase/epimerase [Aliiglaciecola sp. 3_MG-2023]